MRLSTGFPRSSLPRQRNPQALAANRQRFHSQNQHSNMQSSRMSYSDRVCQLFRHSIKRGVNRLVEGIPKKVTAGDWLDAGVLARMRLFEFFAQMRFV